MALGAVAIIVFSSFGQPGQHFPDEPLVVLGTVLVSFFLLVALVGRLWECHVHREIERVFSRGHIPARHRGNRN